MDTAHRRVAPTHTKIEEMHAILLQAKGTRWGIVGLAGVAGLASGLVPKLCRKEEGSQLLWKSVSRVRISLPPPVSPRPTFSTGHLP
jgi:hypothetical protein